jgi:hypothetical protein
MVDSFLQKEDYDEAQSDERSIGRRSWNILGYTAEMARSAGLQVPIGRIVSGCLPEPVASRIRSRPLSV